MDLLVPFHWRGMWLSGRNVFGSEPNDGQIFIAERSRKGSRKLFWSVDARSADRRRRGDAGRRVPTVGNSAQITNPGPPAALGGSEALARCASPPHGQRFSLKAAAGGGRADRPYILYV
jgi:hypothetical protein